LKDQDDLNHEATKITKQLSCSFTYLNIATGFRLEDERDGFVLFVASW